MKIVYSGKCALCETGIETPLKTWNGEILYTGDIVTIHPYDVEHDIIKELPNHLTVVCNNASKYNKSGNPETGFFIMGIASTETVDIGGSYYQKAKDFQTHWVVSRVKSHQDTVIGEHWNDYKFSYKEQV